MEKVTFPNTRLPRFRLQVDRELEQVECRPRLHVVLRDVEPVAPVVHREIAAERPVLDVASVPPGAFAYVSAALRQATRVPVSAIAAQCRAA